MDPVEIEVNARLSRVADGTIPMAMAVENGGDGKCVLYGGKTIIESGAGAWAPEANVTRTNPAGTFDTNMIKLAIAGAFTTGVVASLDIAATDYSVYSSIGTLIQCSINVAAGVLQVGVSETIALGGSPILLDLPAMVAGQWYYVVLDFTGVAADRNAILSFGLNANSDPGAVDVYVQHMGLGEMVYDIAGFAIDDQALADDQYLINQDVDIGALGHMLADLRTGETAVAEQQLYPVPGQGTLSTTSIINSPQVFKPIIATEYQTTAAGRIGVIR
jgi:hypothetical protein